MTPRGIRNNNPLNIELGGDPWQGLSPQQGDGRFAQFDSPEYGIRAAARTLQTYQTKHGLATPRAMIGRWAPAGENDVDAYVSSVAKNSGLNPDEPVDLSRDGGRLLAAMIQHENGQQPFGPETIQRGIQMAGLQGGGGQDAMQGGGGTDGLTLDMIDAEIARRNGSSGAAKGLTVEMIDAEIARRQTAQPSQSPAPSGLEAPRVMINDINAGFQGINPVGTQQQTPIGVVDRDRDGNIRFIDMDGQRVDPARFTPDKFVTMTDPQSGMELLYPRKAENDASMAESAGRVLGFGLPTALPTGKTVAAAAPTAAEALGVTPSIGMTGRPGAMMAAAADSNIAMAGPVARDAERATGEIAAAAGRIADSAGSGISQLDGGSALARGAGEFVDAFKARSQDLYDAVDKVIPKGTRVEVRNTAQAIEGALKVFEDAPNIAKTVGLSNLKGWGADIVANGGQLTWEQIKSLRSEVGGAIGKMKGPLADQADARLKQLYGSLTKDMEEGARANGALREWYRANTFYAKGQKRIDEALDFVFKAKSDEQVFTNAFALTADKGGRANLKKLAALKKSMPPEEWGDFVGTVIRRMGKPSPGAGGAAQESAFSAPAFLTEWNKMDQTAKRVLFQGKDLPKTLAPALDMLAEVSGTVKDAGFQINRSNSGKVIQSAALGSAIVAAPTVAIPAAVMANLTARAMTQPGVIRALVSYGKTGNIGALQRLASGKGAAAVEAGNIIRLLETPE